MGEQAEPVGPGPDPAAAEVGVGSVVHVEPPREHAPGAFVAAWHPRGLRFSWSVWAVASGVLVVLWLMLSLIGGEPGYPWFLWVVVPTGAVLVIHTLSAAGAARRPATRTTEPAGTVCHMPLDETPPEQSQNGRPRNDRPYDLG